MSDELLERLARTSAERLRAEPFEDKKNFMSVYARLSREDGALMAEALAALKRTPVVDDDTIDLLARRSHAACLSYYDGKNKPLEDPMECHRHIVRAVLSELQLAPQRVPSSQN